MATPFQALVAEIRALDGAPKVTYPEGSAAHPVTERVLRLRRGTQAPVFGQAEPDAAQFPHNTLTTQTELKNDAQYVEVYRKYEVLPGPISVSIAPYRETGIPMLVAKQKVSGSVLFTEGEFVPAAIAVSSIAVAVSGVCTVTLASAHDLPPGAWVTFAGTNATPTLNGNQRIVGVPAANQVQIAVAVTVAGTAAGTMQACNRIVRELKSTGNNNVNIKIDTMVAVPGVSALPARNVSAITNNGDGTCTVTLNAAHGLTAGVWATFAGTNATPKIDGPRKILSTPTSTTVVIQMTLTGAGTAAGTMTPMGDLSAFNEDFKCWKDYDFPDYLNAINAYFDRATTSGFNFNSHISWGAAVGLPMQDGYHGPCRARRLRLFFVGAPPDSFEENLQPTFIMPSSGSFVIEGGSLSRIFTPDLINSTFSNSVSFRTGRIPHCLTGPSPAITPIGSGQATVTLNLPESIPPKFNVGDIITLMGQPQKYDAGGLWEVIVYFITVPYTSGHAPP